MQIIGCVGVTYWLNCYLLENYRLCRCNVLIVILRFANYRWYRCNELIEKLLLSKHRLSRCNVLIVILMLVKCRLCRCSVLVEMLFASYRLCRCRLNIWTWEGVVYWWHRNIRLSQCRVTEIFWRWWLCQNVQERRRGFDNLLLIKISSGLCEVKWS